MFVLFAPSLAWRCLDEVRKTNYVLVCRCYFAVELRVLFTTRQLLPATKKDVLPAFQYSNIVFINIHATAMVGK